MDVAACREAARRDRKRYETDNDELVEVALTTAESSLLVSSLLDLWGPAAPTDAMAIAIGFESFDDLIDQYDRLKDLIERRAALMSITDWIRALLATEVCVVSRVEGAGGEWGPAYDDAAIRELRGLQEKLARMGALGRKRSSFNPADSAPTQASPKSIEPSSPADFTPQKIEPSPGQIVPPQHGQTVEDGYSQWTLPRMRRWPDHDRAQGADPDPDPSSEEKSMPTNPHFKSKPPAHTTHTRCPLG